MSSGSNTPNTAGLFAKHQILEKNPILLAIAILIVVAIGGIVQIVPLFYLQSTVEKVDGMRPYTPLELAGLYNTLAARGVHSQVHFVTHVRTYSGRLIYRFHPKRTAVVSQSACNSLHNMLRSAITRGTGRMALSGWNNNTAAGKTGTSDNFRDAWFAGYTSELTTVVWLGNDDNRSLPGGGSTLAAPLWGRFMRAAQTRYSLV